jgi:hypothetical protein
MERFGFHPLDAPFWRIYRRPFGSRVVVRNVSVLVVVALRCHRTARIEIDEDARPRMDVERLFRTRRNAHLKHARPCILEQHPVAIGSGMDRIQTVRPDGVSFRAGLFLSSTRRVASLEGGVRTEPLVSQVKVHLAGLMESTVMKRLGYRSRWGGIVAEFEHPGDRVFEQYFLRDYLRLLGCDRKAADAEDRCYPFHKFTTESGRTDFFWARKETGCSSGHTL